MKKIKYFRWKKCENGDFYKKNWNFYIFWYFKLKIELDTFDILYFHKKKSYSGRWKKGTYFEKWRNEVLSKKYY